MESAYATLIVGVVNFTATVSLVYFSFFHDVYRAKRRPHVLCAEWQPEEPFKAVSPMTLTKKTAEKHGITLDENNQTLAHWLRLSVRNDGTRLIEDLQAIVIDFGGTSQDGRHHTKWPGFVPIRLTWTHTDREATIDKLPVGITRYLDVAAQIFGQPAYLTTEVSHAGNIIPKGSYSFRLVLASSEGVHYRAVWGLEYESDVEINLVPPRSLEIGERCVCIA